jgi:hypothetical protein
MTGVTRDTAGRMVRLGWFPGQPAGLPTPTAVTGRPAAAADAETELGLSVWESEGGRLAGHAEAS